MKMKKAKRTVKRDKNEYEASTRLIEATDSIQSLIHTLSTYDYDGRWIIAEYLHEVSSTFEAIEE
jgi:hypothetical protein